MLDNPQATPHEDDISGQFMTRQHAGRVDDHPFVMNLVDKYGQDHALVDLARSSRPWEERTGPAKDTTSSGSPGRILADPAEKSTTSSDDKENAGMISSTIEPYARILGLSAGAFNRSMASFSDSLDVQSEAISKMTGLPKGGLFEGARESYLKNADYWDSRFTETGLTEEIIAEFFGGAIPGIAEFILGVPWAAGRGFSREYTQTGSPWAGIRGATKEGVHRHIMGKILHASNRLRLLWRSIALGGVSGGEVLATGGGPREAARAAGTLVLLGATAGPGYEGPKLPGLPVRRSASSAETTRPSRASMTEAPGTQEPSRQASAIIEPEASREIRTSMESDIQKVGSGKDLGDTEGISKTSTYKIPLKERRVKPGAPLQLTPDLDQLLEQASELKPAVEGDLGKAIKRAGLKGIKVESRVKERSRINEKVIQKQNKEPGYTYDYMTDILGARITEADPLASNAKLATEMELAGYKLLQTEDFYRTPNGYGYVGIHQLYRAPSGHVFEVQLHTPFDMEMLDKSYGFYARWRSVEAEHGKIPAELVPEFEADIEQVRNDWAEARLKYMAEKSKGPGALGGETPELAPIGGAQGYETSVRHLEGEDTIEYRVVDVSKLQPSHLPDKGFSRNPKYPKEVQPRPYHKDKTLQHQVLRRSEPGTFHPPFLLTDNPDPINGPPIVTENGVVVGGNSRAMLIRRAYDQVPESAEAYKAALADRAATFGLDPAAVEQIERPALVRVLRDPPEDLARLAKNYNEPFTMGQEAGADAMARARVVSPETIKTLGVAVEDFPTLRAYLGSQKSKDLVKALVEDGAIEETHLNRYVSKTTGLLTEDGKRLVEQTLRAGVINDFDLMDAAPLSALQKIDRILPAMARIQARGAGWDITDKLQLALRDLSAYKATDFRSVDAFLAQQDMITPRASNTDPRVYGLLKALAEMKPTEFKGAFDEYATAAQRDIEGQGSLGFYKAETPAEAFERLFTPTTPATKKFMDLLKSERGSLVFTTPEEVAAPGPQDGTTVIRITEAVRQRADEFLDKKVSALDDVPDVEFNWRRIQSAEDVTQAIEKVKRLFPEETLKAKGYRSHEQVQRLAEEMGMSAEQLLKTEGGKALGDSEIQAMRMLHLSSAKRLAELAKKATSVEASEVDLFEFRKHFALHNAIQQQVLRFRAESARALGAWRIHAKESSEMIREIRDVLQGHGGPEWIKEMAGLLSTELDTPGKLSTAAREMARATKSDMLLEAWINGLLSGPQTHAVNTLSNSIVALWQIPERLLASQIGRGFGDQEIGSAEAVHQAFGLVEGFKEGFGLAWTALKHGEPSDAMSKIEARRYRAITGENLNLSGTAGRAVDYLGEFVRLPGRFLMAEDEFFKAVGYRMEKNALAYRQARSEGLEGAELAARIQEIRNDPDFASHHGLSIDAARYQTFTKPLEGVSKHLQQAAIEHPALRLVLPFIRTPVNIARFGALERTPLGFLSKQIRTQIAQGGASRDLALGRIAFGSMVMAAAATMTASGQVTGGGPSDKETRRLMRESGWQPYSIKVGDEYYSYSRLEPLGMILGLGADTAEIIGQVGQEDADNLAATAVMALSKNITSKTYLRGMSETFNVMSDPDRYGERYIQRLIGSVVPTGAAQIERLTDPTLRQAESIMEEIKSRIPGWSDSLPPRRNLFGEPIVLTGGLGPDIISPIYTSRKKEDPVIEEMLAQEVHVSMPAKQIGGVELTPAEYDRYVELAGRGAKDPSTGFNMKQTLADLIRDDEYKRQSDGRDGGKALMIRAYIHDFRELARLQVAEEFPGLAVAMEASRQDQAAELEPQY